MELLVQFASLLWKEAMRAHCLSVLAYDLCWTMYRQVLFFYCRPNFKSGAAIARRIWD
jgi:hypothetical protein